VVVVNYRTLPLTLQLIYSLHQRLDPGPDRIVVVDNRSGDGCRRP
jgi:hypothetical protein